MIVQVDDRGYHTDGDMTKLEKQTIAISGQLPGSTGKGDEVIQMRSSGRW